jgi:hypothetical protein
MAFTIPATLARSSIFHSCIFSDYTFTVGSFPRWMQIFWETIQILQFTIVLGNKTPGGVEEED